MQAGNDYYKILGASKSDTPGVIKKKYRQLARAFHPDQADDLSKEEAEERFKLINQAYSVLSDPEKRSVYDRYGLNGLQQNYSRGFGGATVVYSPFGGRRQKSKRERIEERLSNGQQEIDLNTFSHELGVKLDNLVKIVKIMIEKGIVDGKISQNYIFKKVMTSN